MTTVFVVQGEHWSVPGRPLSVHSTKEGAAAKALELVNVMLKDLDLKPAEKWEEGLRRVKRKVAKEHTYADPDDCDVWIMKEELQP